MILGLKIALIVYGVIGILDGLVLILNPQLFANICGFGEMEIGDFGVYIAAIYGVAFVAASVWFIVVARDPLKHIMWVKFAILWRILVVVVMLYLVVRGTIDFGQVAMGIVGGAVLTVVFLALYPYRTACTNQ